MSNPSALHALEYAPETSFAEDSSTFATARLPLVAAVDPSGLLRNKEAVGLVGQRFHNGAGYARMHDGGTIEVEIDLTGHGSTTAGSPSLSTTETFLGYIWGNVALSLATSQTLTGGTVSAPTTSGASGVVAGGLVRLGSLGDGDGEGQCYAVSSHSGSAFAMLNDLAGAPANGQVIYPMAMMYLHETPYGLGLNASTPGLRLRFLSQNLQYACHGCFPTAMVLSGLSPGERRKARITFEVSRWSAVSATFPSAVTQLNYVNGPNAAGSLFVNDVGTSTRSVRSYRNLSVDITLGMQPVMGPGGISAYQTTIGCVRQPSQVKWSWVEDADATTANPVLQGWGEDNTKRVHILATLSPILGKNVALYSPNVCLSTVPVQFNDGGVNRVRFEGMAETGGTTTTDLTASALRMGWG